MNSPKTIATTVMVLLTCIFFQVANAQNKLLGEIAFPNSGATEAQDDFIQGMLFLHNFEYEDAAHAFRRAQEKDPDFALAYYGEAKTHNHPIWMQQDREGAMEVLNKLGNSVAERQDKAPTQREKDYLMTLEILYGNTSETQQMTKEERDDAYRLAMQRLHETYPEDNEATAFYGLSILGTAHDGRDFGIYMKAAAVLFDVWNENQKHPGAAHYLIHSFDDPIHAPLGLPMAKAYSKIAPAAAHAQHMTSHIFLALGMWENVVEANIVARDVQTSRQKELGETTTVCGHYPWWLQYGYLQEGKVEKAEEVLATCSERLSEEPTDGEEWHFAVMRGHQVVDTEDWDAAGRWSYDFSTDLSSAVNYYFTSALAAVETGSIEEARRNLDKLMDTPESKERDIQMNQIKSLLLLQEGNKEAGLELLQQAVSAETGLPIDFGPPSIVKPSYELLGDVYMDLGRYQEALAAYEKQLERTPNRRRSLLGKEKAMGMASK